MLPRKGYLYKSVRSSGEEVQTSQKRFRGARRNSKQVRVRETRRCECLGRNELLAAIGEGSHNRKGRFTIIKSTKKVQRRKITFNVCKYHP